MAGDKGKAGGLHTGHRQRVKEEFLARGLDGVPDHRVLELLLFYAIPQGDVNPLAHQLIEHFGSLSGVFLAPYEELLKVKGIGANAATLIKLLPAVYGRYQADRMDPERQLTCARDYGAVLAPYFFGARVEKCFLLCLDGKGKLITCRQVGEGVLNQVSVPPRRVVETALVNNAAQVVLAHNHTSGVALPSSADKEYTKALKKLLWEVEVRLKDHIVLVDGDMVSMAESGMLNY